MLPALLVVHILSITLLIGSLFTQSLILVLRQKLQTEEHITIVQKIQRKAHLVIYHPSLAIAIISGLTLAVQTGAFTAGKWLHWKLIFVFLLIGVGVVAGILIKKNKNAKALEIAIHVSVLILAAVIIYFARIKPF